ncbi:MAG TPA: hypothetical protein VGC58_02585 [Candidatus Paceibacterota bacterium]
MEQEIKPEQLSVNPLPTDNKNKAVVTVSIVSVMIIVIIAILGYFIFSKNSLKTKVTQIDQSPIPGETVAYIPLVFSENGVDIKTSTCLQIREKPYTSDKSSWNTFKNEAEVGPEKDLVKVITAIQNKDSKLFKELSHSVLGTDPEKSKKSETSYFKQFENLQVEKVWGYQKLGNVLVFYLQLVSSKGNSGFLDIPFALEKTGEFGFLPYESGSVDPELAKDWFNSDFGPGKTLTPSYCSPSLIKQMTHKVPLEAALNSPAELLLLGNNLFERADGQSFASNILDQFTKMQKDLASGQMNEYFGGFTASAEKVNRDWFLQETSEVLKKQYVDNFINQKPFFIFNADPVFVLYSLGKGVITTDNLHISYFVRNSDGQFKMTKESFGSPFDNTFKSKMFIEAANLEIPFSTWQMK